jgi:hypothetical protein
MWETKLNCDFRDSKDKDRNDKKSRLGETE